MDSLDIILTPRALQPRPQGLSLKNWVGHPFFKEKALGTRLRALLFFPPQPLRHKREFEKQRRRRLRKRHLKNELALPQT